MFRCDRDREATHKTMGGGCLIAVKNTFQAFCVSFPALPASDCVWVRLRLKKFSLWVCVVYISCNSNAAHYEGFYDGVSALASQILPSDRILLVGDFNLPNFSSPLQITDDKLLALSNFMSSHNLTSFNSITNCNNRTLDLVLSNVTALEVAKESPLLALDAHHPALRIRFSTTIGRQPSRDPSSADPRYNFFRADFEALYRDFAITDWTPVYNLSDVDSSLHEFYRLFYEVLDRHVPKTTPRVRSHPPWFDAALIQRLRANRKLEKKRYFSAEHNATFISHRQAFNQQIRDSYISYIQATEGKLQADPRTFFTVFKNKKYSSSGSIPTMDGNPVADSQTASDLLATHFQRSFSSDISSYDSASICSDTVQSDTSSILHIATLSRDDLAKAVRQLKSSRSVGPDSVPQYLVKGLFEVIVEPLLYIFNVSLHSSRYPTLWKTATVIPIPKVANSVEITEQRPISLLSPFSKLFDASLHCFIQPHYSTIAAPEQHGFMRKRSTITNLVGFTQDISDALDKGLQVHCVFTDFEKAFDRVHHDVLLQKLRLYGFSSSLISFFCSYLSGREFRVLFKGAYSRPIAATSGVPQGGNLGPDLFLYLGNDLPSYIQYSSSPMFCDDLKTYKVVSSPKDCEYLQSDLNQLDAWSIQNKLPFNYSKCKFMSFFRSRQPLTYTYSMGGQNLVQVSEYQDLGVLFDQGLTFYNHIVKILNKAYKTLGYVKRNSKFLSHTTILLLYNSLVRPQLEYAAIVWSPHHSTYIQILESLQHKFLRFLFFKKHGRAPPIDTRTSTLLVEFPILRLQERRMVSQIIFLHKLLNGYVVDSSLLRLVSFLVPLARTRASNSVVTFQIPRTKTHRHEHSPMFSLLSSYNLLSTVLPSLDLSLRTNVLRKMLMAAKFYI